MTIADTGISLGTTLYSFSNEWVFERPTLTELLSTVAAAGIGPGVEIVGFQSLKGYPHVAEETVRTWRDTLERHHLTGSCLSSNIDVALRPDRRLSTDEMVDYLAAQISAARDLGFPVLRMQMGATPDVVERVEPIAERAKVVLGMEIHAPESPLTPGVATMRELYDRLDSEWLGFIPDFSSTMHSLPPGFLRMMTRAGLPHDILGELSVSWARDGAPHERYAQWAAVAVDAGVDASVIGEAQLAFTMFGHEPMDSWEEIHHQIVHVHGKFYEIADGIEPSIDYAAAMQSLVRGSFRGFISTEWEGHVFADHGDVDVVDMIQRHHRLATDQIRRAHP